MGRNHFDAKSGQVESPSSPPPSPPPPLPHAPPPVAETGLVRTCSAPLLPPYRYVALTLLPGPAHTLYCIVQAKGRVGDVWDQMCRFLGHPDPNPFGLAIFLENEFMFLENDSKLAKYAPKVWRNSGRYGLDAQGKPMLCLHLRIQYYLDWHFLSRDRVVREHYYQQVRLNVLRQSIGDWCWSNEARYFLLAAYALQADVGPSGSHFFDPTCYFPQKVLSRVGAQYVRENIPKIHEDSSVATLSRGQAQLEFLHEASVPPAPHNMALYRLWAGKPPSAPVVHVGLNTNGITIFQEMNEKDKCEIVAQLTWPSIVKLSFEKRKFEVRVPGNKYTYWAKSERKANLLLSHCRRTHQFSMTLQARFSHLPGPGARDKYAPCETLKKLGVPAKGAEGEGVVGSSGGSGRSSNSDQRVSVISSASSNTTSGIVSDSRIHSSGNSEDEMDLDVICGSVESLGIGRERFSCCSDCVDCRPYTSGKTDGCWTMTNPRCGKRKPNSSRRECDCHCRIRGNVLSYPSAPKGASSCDNSGMSLPSCSASTQVMTSQKSKEKNWTECSGCSSSGDVDEDRNNHLCDCQLNGTFTCGGHDSLPRQSMMRNSGVRRPCDSLGCVIDSVLTDNDEDDDDVVEEEEEEDDDDEEDDDTKEESKTPTKESLNASEETLEEPDCKELDISRDEYLIEPKEGTETENRSPTDNYVDFFDLYEFNEFLPEEEEVEEDVEIKAQKEIAKMAMEEKVIEVIPEKGMVPIPERRRLEEVVEEKEHELEAEKETDPKPEAENWKYTSMPRLQMTGSPPPPPLPPKCGSRKSTPVSTSSWSLLKSLRRVAKRVAATQQVTQTNEAEEAIFISSKTKINVLTAHATSVSSACPSFARPTVANSSTPTPNWTSPPPPPPPMHSLPNPPPPPPPPARDLPFVGVNNYLNVHASTMHQMDWFSSLSTRKLKQTKQYASTCASTPCLLDDQSQHSQSQMSEFHAQLCSDVDYVIYPDKDPELSRQEYMDAKSASRIALEAQQMNCACCYSATASSAGGGVYQSLSAGSTTYGSLTYETVPCYGYRINPAPAVASDSGYGPSSGRHSLSLSSCYAPSAANSDTYYEAIQQRPRLTRILGANGHGTTHYPFQGKASSDTYETIRPPLHYGTAACSLAQKAQSIDNLGPGPETKMHTGPLGLSEMDINRLEEHSKTGDLPLISALLTSFQRSGGAGPGSSATTPRPPSDRTKSKFPNGPANRPLPPLPPPPLPPPHSHRPSHSSQPHSLSSSLTSVAAASSVPCMVPAPGHGLPPVPSLPNPSSSSSSSASRKSHSLLLPFAKYGKNSYNITPSRPKIPAEANRSQASLPPSHHHHHHHRPAAPTHFNTLPSHHASIGSRIHTAHRTRPC